MRSYDRNTYYILELPLAAVQALLKRCVGDTPTELYDGSYLVKIGIDVTPPSAFNAQTPLTHSEMKVEKAIREQGRPVL